MARECLPRNPETRQYTGELSGQIGDRARELVEQLCEEFPTVDLFDLEHIFTRAAAHAFSMQLLKDFNTNIHKESSREGGEQND